MTRAVRAPVVCAVAVGEAEVAGHHRVRRAVFVVEQKIFTGTDVDAEDARDDVLHVVARLGDDIVGAVRLFPLDPARGLWQGDRLAVVGARRAVGAGAPLVRFAVAAATARGGRRMVAHVQPANRRFFERLGWTAGGTEEYAGHPHVLMGIALGADPGSADPGHHETTVRDEAGPQLGR